MARLSSNQSKSLGEQNVEREMFVKALNNDISMSISPATVAPEPTAAAWTRSVQVKIVDSAGNTHTWVNSAYTTTVSIADTSTAGTASIASTTLTLVNGVANITVSGDEADWLDTETDTLTIGNITLAGITVTGGTSVETFTA
jgi:hypothetical protein